MNIYFILIYNFCPILIKNFDATSNLTYSVLVSPNLAIHSLLIHLNLAF